MEKYTEKEKDYLRWYTGDIRERTAEGYLISSYTQKSASQYKLVNMLLYEGMENEYERLKDNSGYLPIIKDINEVLSLYEALINVAKHIKCETMVLYRIERQRAIIFLKQKKFNPSFLSCSKDEPCAKFEYKNDSRIIKLELKNAYVIDVYEVLKNEYEKNDEKEVIILPFHSIVYDERKSCFIVMDELTNSYTGYNKSELLKFIVTDNEVKNANSVIESLNYHKTPTQNMIEKYINWKHYVQEYIKQLISEKSS